jgi:cytochrome c oxidase subunit 3
MEVGSLESLELVEAEGPSRLGSARGVNPPGDGGGRRGPGGSGGDGADETDGDDQKSFIAAKSRIFTGFLLLVVLMTFCGLIAAYVVLATNRSIEWQPFRLPVQVWISTAIIVVSSIAYHLGQSATVRNNQPAAKRWFIITTVLGAMFISSQLLAWVELRYRGLYIAGNPYVGFFYVFTIVHAVHVLGGVAALGSILLRVWHPVSNNTEIFRRKSVAQVVGWYWHFMGGLWIVLFLLLGFWK